MKYVLISKLSSLRSPWLLLLLFLFVCVCVCYTNHVFNIQFVLVEKILYPVLLVSIFRVVCLAFTFAAGFPIFTSSSMCTNAPGQLANYSAIKTGLVEFLSINQARIKKTQARIECSRLLANRKLLPFLLQTCHTTQLYGTIPLDLLRRQFPWNDKRKWISSALQMDEAVKRAQLPESTIVMNGLFIERVKKWFVELWHFLVCTVCEQNTHIECYWKMWFWYRYHRLLYKLKSMFHIWNEITFLNTFSLWVIAVG